MIILSENQMHFYCGIGLRFCISLRIALRLFHFYPINLFPDQLSESHTVGGTSGSSSGSLTLPSDYKYSNSVRSQATQQGRWMNTLSSKSTTSKRSLAGSKNATFISILCLLLSTYYLRILTVFLEYLSMYCYFVIQVSLAVNTAYLTSSRII